MSIPETSQHLCSQLEASKQDFGDITAKFLTCQAAAQALAKQLQKYKYEDLTESVLKEDAPFEEGDLAEVMGTAAWLGRYEYLIQAQARELAHLRWQVQEGKGVCDLFTQHVRTAAKSFENLFGTTDLACHQGQRFCEQLAQGSQLAESLASKLGPENQNDKDEDGQKAVAPRRSRGLQKEEVNEVLEDSLDERYLTHSSGHDSSQPPSSDAFLCAVQKSSSAVAIATKDISSLAHIFGGVIIIVPEFTSWSLPPSGGSAPIRFHPTTGTSEGEIQNLHQHLEEILFINGCLGDNLEHRLSIADKGGSTGGPGCTSNLYREILESVVQLHNENREIGKETGGSRLT
ncbi:neuroblastoma breakpoint family member 6-like protein [Sturnira hondurensis]|uniref:neuroblastoma breakpoint family member 6-like protein n=1 Tax=Sturnira hondurensis TaxID=192404 RepID=UPI00187A6FCE|nr:neuroblastoma breakpoint family member 6-like protein [Sturnira hondurensis]